MMGGAAFPSLLISRIHYHIYPNLLTHLRPILTPYYHITSPPTAPGKDTHGDIDLIILARTLPAPTPATITPLLKAHKHVQTANSPTTSYAVPFPADPTRLFQLDLHLCENQKDLKWTLFTHSYGDLGAILREITRRVGLKLDHQGLKLRFGMNGGTLELSSDPARVLGFMGLGEAEFKKGWEEKSEMFEYARKSRFFSAADGGGSAKARERRKGKKREGLRQWWKFVDSLGKVEAKLEVDQVREEALDWFGKRREYDEMVTVEEKRLAPVKAWERARIRLRTEKAADVEGRLVLRAVKARWLREGGDLEGLDAFVNRVWSEESEKVVAKKPERERMALRAGAVEAKGTGAAEAKGTGAAEAK